LDLIRRACPAGGRVIDVGGGQSLLVDRLLEAGFCVAVLDISSVALERTKARLGERAGQVEWILADVAAVPSVGTFDVWHDRAVFHFLTQPQDRQHYSELAARTVPAGGHLVLGAFALDGPEKCSGLPVCRYDAPRLARELDSSFRLVDELAHEHTTPGGKVQSFFFGLFERA
jgi:SAM-dependent methyltransferase